MDFYKRHLPHWQPAGAEFFVTFRLDGSLPKHVVELLRNQREQLRKKNETSYRSKIFKKYESLLDGHETGPTWLKEEKIANIVQEALHFYDDKSYDLYAYCVMPNHVHVVFKDLSINKETGDSETNYPVTTVLHGIKSYTALKCNRSLGRTGAFWQPESYDRVIRDQNELENTIRYTLNNPVKAAMVQKWNDWPYNYCKPEFTESLM